MKKYWTNRSKWCNVNNKGSALLTVIIAVAFLSILATTLLYVTGMNFMIKQADYQNKKNFYTGETALEEIRANLMSNIVSEAAREAYSQACITYSTAGNHSVREVEYNGYFVDAVKDKLGTAIGSNSWSGYLSSSFSDVQKFSTSRVTLQMLDASGNVMTDGGSVARDLNTNELVKNTTFDWDELKGIVTINNIQVTYVNEKSVATVITTNLELHAPEVKWDAESSLKAFAPVTPVPGETPKDQKAKDPVQVTRAVLYTNWVKR